MWSPVQCAIGLPQNGLNLKTLDCPNLMPASQRVKSDNALPNEGIKV